MPADREDAEGREGEQSDQDAARSPDRQHRDAREPSRDNADELLSGAPAQVVGGEREVHAPDDTDGEWYEEHEPGDQGGGPQRRERAQTPERRQRPPDPERRQEHGADPETLPAQTPQPLTDAAGEVPGKQCESEEQPDDERADADQLRPRLRVHVMWRSV